MHLLPPALAGFGLCPRKTGETSQNRGKATSSEQCARYRRRFACVASRASSSTRVGLLFYNDASGQVVDGRFEAMTTM